MKENRLIWSFHLSILALISQVQYDAWVIVFRITPDRPKVFLIRFHLYSSDFFGGIAETTWTSFLLGFLLGYFISFVCPFIRSFSEAKFTFQGFFLVSLQFRALTVHDKTEHRYVTSSATNNHTYTNTLNDNTWTRKYVVKETEASNNTSRKGRIFITYIIFISPTNAKLCRRNYTKVWEFMRFRFVTFLTFFLWLQLKKVDLILSHTVINEIQLWKQLHASRILNFIFYPKYIACLDRTGRFRS